MSKGAISTKHLDESSSEIIFRSFAIIYLLIYYTNGNLPFIKVLSCRSLVEVIIVNRLYTVTQKKINQFSFVCIFFKYLTENSECFSHTLRKV